MVSAGGAGLYQRLAYVTSAKDALWLMKGWWSSLLCMLCPGNTVMQIFHFRSLLGLFVALPPPLLFKLAK